MDAELEQLEIYEFYSFSWFSNKLNLIFYSKQAGNIRETTRKFNFIQTGAVPQFSEQHVTSSDSEHPIFHLSTILVATDNFSIQNKLGQGGFGPVYKVSLLIFSQEKTNALD